MDPLTLCLKRQRTGYATATTPCQPSSVLPSLSLSLSRLCLCVWVCVCEGWGLLLEGLKPIDALCLAGELALWKVAVSSTPATPFFIFPFSSIFCSALALLHLRNYVPYISLLVHKEYFNFSAHRTHCVAQVEKVFLRQLSSCEIFGPPDDFCLAFLWSWMADRSVPPTWQLSQDVCGLLIAKLLSC